MIIASMHTSIYVRLFLPFILIFLLFNILGCEKDSNSVEPDQTELPDSPSDSTETLAVSGTISMKDFGEGSLNILSLRDPDNTGTIDSIGNFKTIVSRNGCQLLFVTDDAGELRGLAISILKYEEDGIDNLEINAESSLLGVLMLSPGIISVSRDAVRSRIAEFRTISRYQETLDIFKQRLPKEKLTDILSDESIKTSLREITDAWFENFSEYDQITPGKMHSRVKGGSFLNLTFPEKVEGAIEVELSNRNWRHVKLLSRALNRDGVLVNNGVVVEARDVKGGISGTWGTFLTGTLGSPTKFKFNQHFGPIGNCENSDNFVAKREYWIIGPGAAQVDLQLEIPGDIYSEATIYWQEANGTALDYVIFPFINMVIGVRDLKNYFKSEEATLLYKDLSTKYGQAKQVKNFIDVLEKDGIDKAKAIEAALADLAVFMVGVMINEAASSSDPAFRAIGKFLGAIATSLNLLMDGLNLAVVTNHLMVNPRIIKHEMETDGIIEEVTVTSQNDEESFVVQRGKEIAIEASAFGAENEIAIDPNKWTWDLEINELVKLNNTLFDKRISLTGLKGGKLPIGVKENVWCNETSFELEVLGVENLVTEPDGILNIAYEGEVDILVKAFDKNGEKLDLDGSNFVWSVGDRSIAYAVFDLVNFNTIKGVDVGSTKLTVTEKVSGKKTLEVVLNVVGIDRIVATPDVNVSIISGQTASFLVTAYDQFDNALTIKPEMFEWILSDNSVIEASNQYGNTVTVTGLSEGNAIVIAKERYTDKLSNPISIKVTGINHVIVTPSQDQDISIGGTAVFTATAYDQSNQVIDIDPEMFKWFISEGGIISIDKQFGNPVTITSNSEGNAAIVAQEKYSDKMSNSVRLKVVGIDRLELLPMQDRQMVVGETLTFNVVAYDLFDQVVDLNGDSYEWSASNSQVVSIGSGAGTAAVITADSEGLAQLSVREISSDVGSNSINIEVKAVDRVTILPPGDIELGKGDSFGFTAAAYDKEGNVLEVDGSNFAWSNSNPQVIELSNASGNSVSVTGLDGGTAQITVQENFSEIKSDPVNITVNGIGSIDIIPDEPVNLFVGKSKSLSLRVYDYDGVELNPEEYAFEWVINDSHVASLNPDFGSSTEITGSNAGFTYLYVLETTSGVSSDYIDIQINDVGGSWDWYENESQLNCTLYINSNNKQMQWVFPVVIHTGSFTLDGDLIEFNKTQVYASGTRTQQCTGYISEDGNTIIGTFTVTDTNGPDIDDPIPFKAVRQ